MAKEPWTQRDELLYQLGLNHKPRPGRGPPFRNIPAPPAVSYTIADVIEPKPQATVDAVVKAMEAFRIALADGPDYICATKPVIEKLRSLSVGVISDPVDDWRKFAGLEMVEAGSERDLQYRAAGKRFILFV